MLPRVTAALSQFIAPITSAANRSSVQEKKSGEQSSSGFERQSKRNLKVVRLEPEKEKPAPTAVVAPSSPMRISVTGAFIQLLALIHKHRGSLMKWMGPRAYRSALNEQKQAGKFRKGSVLDIKAD